MIQEFTSHEFDKKSIDITYFDFNNSSTITSEIPMSRSMPTEIKNASIVSNVKSIILDELKSDINIKQMVAEFLFSNVQEISTLPKFNKSDCISFDDIKHKLMLKLQMYSNYMLHTNRYGKPNTIVMNKINLHHLSFYLVEINPLYYV